MTISAQVIDTIVEWIDDNLHQPLRIDDIARHAGYSKWHLQRLFLQYKGRAWGAIFAKGSCCWPPAICATPISGSTISASSMALIRNRPLPASLPGPSISRRAPTAKRTTVAPTEARLSWFNARGKTSDATPSAAPDTQWRPALRTTDKQHRIELVEIHHMECLNQLLRQRQAQRRRGQQQTGEQASSKIPAAESSVSSGCFMSC